MANDIEPWTGVRNHSAKLNLKAMQHGDRAFFYHSNEGKEIVGVVEVVREAFRIHRRKGDWVCVDMKAVGPIPKPVTLVAIKADPEFADFALVRLSRLSVVPSQSRIGTAFAGWADGRNERAPGAAPSPTPPARPRREWGR